MTDPRAENVQRFRDEHGAQQVVILTAVTPFKVSQDRAIVVLVDYHAQLITCSGCTPRTALGQGIMRNVAPKDLMKFLDSLEAADEAWDQDAVPPNVHDGVTLTIEKAGADGYHRVRIVDPEPDSPHAQMIAAWTTTFPEVRKIVG